MSVATENSNTFLLKLNCMFRNLCILEMLNSFKYFSFVFKIHFLLYLIKIRRDQSHVVGRKNDVLAVREKLIKRKCNRSNGEQSIGNL